nr:uncharacterized protein LOC117849836 [Setaria viridis]
MYPGPPSNRLAPRLVPGFFYQFFATFLLRSIPRYELIQIVGPHTVQFLSLPDSFPAGHDSLPPGHRSPAASPAVPSPRSRALPILPSTRFLTLSTQCFTPQEPTVARSPPALGVGVALAIGRSNPRAPTLPVRNSTAWLELDGAASLTSGPYSSASPPHLLHGDWGCLHLPWQVCSGTLRHEARTLSRDVAAKYSGVIVAAVAEDDSHQLGCFILQPFPIESCLWQWFS